MKATQLLHNLGQSLWLDNITRDLLTNGTLKRYVDELSVTGLTSNPTIFNQAIRNSSAYEAGIRSGLEQSKSSEAIFLDLALEDLTRVADLLKPVYGLEKTLLRKAGQGLLPDAILSRPKRAFNASLANLFESAAGQVELNRALRQPFIANLFRQENLERILIEDSRSQVFHRTWLICSLGMWSDVCGVSEIC